MMSASYAVDPAMAMEPRHGREPASKHANRQVQSVHAPAPPAAPTCDNIHF